MKKIYDEPKMEAVISEAEDDIIATSGVYGAASVGGAIDGGGMINWYFNKNRQSQIR